MTGMGQHERSATASPLVTIVTPSLNQREFLEDALISVARQSFPSIEHVVIDGGSTDRTLELLRRYQSAYQLRWRSGPDAGQSDAVNKGFALAQGELIGWLNADDAYFSADVIQAVVETFAARPDASVVYGDCAFISRRGTVFRVAPAMRKVSRARLRYHSISQPSVFFRRQVVQDYPLRQDLHYLLDYEYWLRLCSKTAFVHLEKIVAAYRVYPESKSFKRAVLAGEEWRMISQEYFGGRRRPRGPIEILRGRFLAFRLRMRGLHRLPEVYRSPLAFPGLRPPRFWLWLQQLFVPLGAYARYDWTARPRRVKT